MSIFFVGPKKTNEKKGPFFEGVAYRFFQKPLGTAIKSEQTGGPFLFQGLFMTTLTKKMNLCTIFLFETLN
jgi:hypothetical protein